MTCACGSRATYLTLDGDDVCGPCLRAQGAEARVPPMLLDLATERRHHRAACVEADVASVVVAPKPPVPVDPLAKECVRCHRVLRLKSRGACSGCYSFGLRTNTLDSFALPPATDWHRAASAKGVEARLSRASS